MRRLLEFLIDGCWHHWKAMNRVRVYEKTDSELPIGYKYIYQCAKCNKIKSIEDF